jgi:hypothetical protein
VTHVLGRCLSVLLGVLLLAPLGCSISTSPSDSSAASSDSSAASSKSSTSSSPSGGSDASAYRRDLRDYTAGYVKSGGQHDAFQKHVTDIARKNGITNWEDNLESYVGIGEGLKQAGASPTALEAYKTNLAAADNEKRRALQKGYDGQ